MPAPPCRRPPTSCSRPPSLISAWPRTSTTTSQRQPSRRHSGSGAKLPSLLDVSPSSPPFPSRAGRPSWTRPPRLHVAGSRSFPSAPTSACRHPRSPQASFFALFAPARTTTARSAASQTPRPRRRLQCSPVLAGRPTRARQGSPRQASRLHPRHDRQARAFPARITPTHGPSHHRIRLVQRPSLRVRRLHPLGRHPRRPRSARHPVRPVRCPARRRFGARLGRLTSHHPRCVVSLPSAHSGRERQAHQVRRPHRNSLLSCRSLFCWHFVSFYCSPL
jgi:hypothetical protein